MSRFKLTVVDQSPVQLGSSNAAQAPALSAELAIACESFGYHRYWVAEHHNSNCFAGPCPEVLISHIAAKTQTIRVGSGGVMLTNHSVYKVAEQFRMLATLYPERIDLGIGRAPGGDGLASHALAWPYEPIQSEHYATQANLLAELLRDGLPEDHPWLGLRVMPDDTPSPDLWMLGTSGGSAELAGELGYAMSLGLFISPGSQTVDIMQAYQAAWKKAGHSGTPQTMITVSALCAETREEALFFASSQAYWKTMAFKHGIREPWLSPQEATDKSAKLSPGDKQYYESLMAAVTLGSPEECSHQLEQLSEYWQTDEIGLVTVTHDYETRKNSYRLFAEAAK